VVLVGEDWRETLKEGALIGETKLNKRGLEKEEVGGGRE